MKFLFFTGFVFDFKAQNALPDMRRGNSSRAMLCKSISAPKRLKVYSSCSLKPAAKTKQKQIRKI